MSGTPEGARRKAAGHLGLSLEEYDAKRDGGEKWCSGHKRWEPVGGFGLGSDRGDGLYPSCLDWAAYYQRATRAGADSTRRRKAGRQRRARYAA